jgi:hypothetical protein
MTAEGRSSGGRRAPCSISCRGAAYSPYIPSLEGDSIIATKVTLTLTEVLLAVIDDFIAERKC